MPRLKKTPSKLVSTGFSRKVFILTVLVSLFAHCLDQTQYLLAQENSSNTTKKKESKEKFTKSEEETNWAGVSIAFGGPLLIIGTSTVNWYLTHKPTFASDNFNMFDRGWFGRNTYAGGHDKIGHFTSNYIFQYAFTGMFENWAGYSRETSIWTGALITFIGFNMIEFFDSFTDFGWEYGDSIMNVLGQAMAIFSQYTNLDQFIQLRLAWVPSPMYLREEKVKYYEFLEDYNGQRFFAVINTAGISDKLKLDLKFFRYLMPTIYYDTRGYRPELPDDRYHLRERNIGGGLALDFAAIFKDWKPDSSIAQAMGTFFSFYQPSIFVGYSYDLNHYRWHSPDLTLTFTGPF